MAPPFRHIKPPRVNSGIDPAC